jgi:hypothetical protein
MRPVGVLLLYPVLYILLLIVVQKVINVFFRVSLADGFVFISVEFR